MKKSTYLFALALGASTITFAQNVGVNTDGSDPDANTILHIKNHSESSLDPAVVRIENEKAGNETGVQIENSGTASSKWDIIVPGSSTDLRIKGNGSDHVTIQNDGDVGIGTTSPASTLDIEGSIGLKYNTINTAATLDNTYNVVFCDGGDYTVTLPAATTCEGRVYYIKNIDAEGDDITIDGHGSETIDGSETYVLDCENDVIRILSNGSSWYIIDEANRTCASANAGASLAAICQGETSAAMGGSVGGSATGGTWSGGSGTWTNADDPSAATYTADASESGSINLTLTTSDGTATATKTITVNANPTANAGASLAAICQGETSAAMGGSVGGGATGGTWSGGSGTWTNATNPSTATYTAGASESGPIILTLTTSGGSCGTTTATKTITVNDNPTANAGASLAAICQGETSAAMGGSVGGSATGGTWSGGSGTWTNATNPSTATYTAGASESGSITLTLTTSGGSCGTTTPTKTITVNASNTAGAASSEPTLDVNTPLTDITHTTTGATGIGTATGLPAGVTAAWASNTITISGTPTADGTFNYSIPLTGGCGSVNATGTIIVEAVGFTTCGDDVTFTYNGNLVTYETVPSSVTGGPCWMDRNLGASDQASSATDHNGYGDLFQWGRAATDGHQLINWINGTSSPYTDGNEQLHETFTTSSSPSPGHNDFIKINGNWYTGSSPLPNNLWKEDGTGDNNPCPDGWRVPTRLEWLAENSAGNANFPKYAHLKLPMAGRRYYSVGSLDSVGSSGFYWSSTVSGTNAYLLYFLSSGAYVDTSIRANGGSVRCLKE